MRWRITCKTLDDEGAIQADERHDVGDRRQRDEIERGEEIGRLAVVPETGLPQGAIERDQGHRDHAGGAEIAEAGEIVLPVGIDDGQRGRQRFRRLMMVEHDDVEPEPPRLGERLMADRAAVDRHQQARALGGEAGDRLDIGAVAFGDAIGDVNKRLAAASVEEFGDQRRAAGAVDVVIAEDRDPFALHRGARQTLRRRLHVAQDEGVGHQIAQGGIEIALDVVGRDAASGEHAGDELVVARRLGDRERARLARGVEPRPPGAPEDRALDIEEIAVTRHDDASLMR